MEKERQYETATEKKEYPFEEGVERIMENIHSLLLVQKYVVVGIAGPCANDTNVGKTFLSSDLSKQLRQQGIPCILTSDEDSLTNQSTKEMDHGVIILGAMCSLGNPSKTIQPDEVEKYKAYQDSKVVNVGKIIELPLKKIDIRIFIYRPGKPIYEGDYMYNDIVINNKKAVDKESCHRIQG